MQRTAEIEVKVIEAVVYRILQEREESSPNKDVIATSDKQAKILPQPTEEIDFDEALEALGSDGLNAVAGALEMFRNK